VLDSVITDLRSVGARLAVDDVGAGYASLQHILELNPEIVKLDVSLCRSIDSDAARRFLAKGLVWFASCIGADVVAEGVETAEELATLTELGVPFAQGYYLGRPAPLNGALVGQAAE
jgi:EAL domain-containing protein (putative c-di-GMP-specific phosphodiesterase class I)